MTQLRNCYFRWHPWFYLWNFWCLGGILIHKIKAPNDDPGGIYSQGSRFLQLWLNPSIKSNPGDTQYFKTLISVVIIILCILCGSSSISEEHSGDSLPVDGAATHLHCLCSDWLESQQRTVSFLCDPCIVCHQHLPWRADDWQTVVNTDCTQCTDCCCVFCW